MNKKRVPVLALLVVVLLIGAVGYLSSSSQPCAQVLVTATNRFTGDKKIFGNHCSVPLWYKNVRDYNYGEVKFTGTVQAIEDQSSLDGALSIQVNDKWITAPAGLAASGTKIPAGSIIGYDSNHKEANVGKKAEVYAAQMVPEDANSLTLIGSNAYYVKILKEEGK